MRKTLVKITTVFIVAGILFSSCKKPQPIPPKGDYENGYLILNEGQFMHDNATVSFVKKDFTGQEDSVYYKVNNELMGDVAQSLFANDDKAYFVINNSHKIVTTNRWTLEKKGIITSMIQSPRYMVKVSDRYAVVSNWGEIYDSNWQDVHDDFLAWVDLENDVVTDTLHVATGPNRMLFDSGKLYVLIPGVMTSNNQVAVIDASGRTQIGSITVGDVPQAIVKKDGYLWVLCSGNPSWSGNETDSQLVKIDPATDQVVSAYTISPIYHPRYMAAAGNYLYVLLDNKIYQISPANPDFNAWTEVLDLNGTVQTPYGMKIIEDKLFITDALDYQSPGKVFVFDTDNFSLIAELTAGYLPNDVVINQ